MAIALVALIGWLAPPTAQGASFLLSWTNFDSNVDGFLLERSIDAVNFFQIAQMPSSQFAYQDLQLASGLTYYYRLRDYNPAGDSPYSDVVMGTTPTVPGAAAPVANFSASQIIGAAPLMVNFTEMASGTITSISWNFGDGTSSTQANPSHTYQSAGSYTVTMTVTGPGGTNVKTLSNFILVQGGTADAIPPALTIVSPTGYQTVYAAALTVSGTASDASGIQSVTVNGQVATLNGANWSAPLTLLSGINTLTVIATDNSPQHNRTTQIVQVVLAGNAAPPSAAPFANFSASQIIGPAPLPVNFTDMASGNITSLNWDFGDGTSSTQANPSHTYQSAGSYTVTMTVIGPGGTNVKKLSNFILVQSAAKVAQMMQMPASQTARLAIPSPNPACQPMVINPLAQVGNITVITAGEPVAFNVATTDSSSAALSYVWDFGDQQTGVGSAPVHVYANTNCQSYPVSVVVSDGINSLTGLVQVAVACRLEVSKLQLLPNTSQEDADHFNLIATLDLGSRFDPVGQPLGIDFGGAQVAFQLDHSGHGTSDFGRCRLNYNQRTELWTLTARLKNGNWHDQWAAAGLTQQSSSAAVPVIVVAGVEAFAAQP